MNNLKQTGLAVHSYHDVHRFFPGGTMALHVPPEQRLSWLVTILPFMEQDPLFRKINVHEGWQAARNQAAGATFVPAYSCPGQDFAPPGTPALSAFVGMAGVGKEAAALPLHDSRIGFFGYDRRITREDIVDGASNCILAVETRWENGPWIAGGRSTVRGSDPLDRPYIGVSRPFGSKHRADNFFRTHPVIAHIVLVDGSCRTLEATMSAETFQSLATIAGRDSK
jgi:hypothetical protein